MSALKRYVRPSFSREGIAFKPETTSADRWLEQGYENSEDPRLAALLAQLLEDGFVRVETNYARLSWQDFYALRDTVGYENIDALLGLPPEVDLRPMLSSKGGLTDPDFLITLTGWTRADGGPVRDQVEIKGGVVSLRGEEVLLPVEAWQVLDGLAKFHARPKAERTADSNRHHWAELRKAGIAAGSSYSDFLKKTIVLTPDMLKLDLSKVQVGDESVIEIQPAFEGAPEKWLTAFDGLARVPERYDITDGSDLIQVLINDNVRSVLDEIKKLPGRRVAGDRADALIRNPYSLLGPAASSVLDPEQFQIARERAGISTATFVPSVTRNQDEAIKEVSLRIETVVGDEGSEEQHVFDTPRALEDFVTRLQERLARGASCLRWKGHELEILGDTADHLAMLKGALNDWLAPERVTVDTIFDASKYSERIEGFGEEEQYASPFIERKDEGAGWFPENIDITILWPSQNGGEPIRDVMTTDRIEEFARAVETAQEKLKPTVTIPGTPYEVSVGEAQQILNGLRTAEHQKKSANGTPPKKDPNAPKPPKIHLKLKSNIDQVDYAEARSDRLRLPSGQSPDIPGSLRPEVELREHQRDGVAWIQHLWRHSPADCRGALLADDMGLGKTIQLLTFIASCLEKDPALDPILVVAPVALLENWRDEIEKFFTKDSLPVLLLSGKDLSSRRVSKAAIDEQLKQQGLTRLLRPDWLGDAKVVLTTYETLRDLEFSLAAQRWSIMVCDEAQKIKNPNAMVTRAAKKQNVRFRIACTGTPVENTLTDLWCLFDFIQPGYLGSLTEFGQKYRKPIEAQTDEEKARVEELRSLIAIQLLRRTKQDVAKDLPKKIESCHKLPISNEQRRHYARVMHQLRQTENGSKHLEMIQVLRRISSDPFAFDVVAAESTPVEGILEANPKMRWLMDVLRDIRQRGEKAIVFCEFRDLQRTIQRCVTRQLDVHADIVNGDTSASAASANSRQKRIKRFQESPGFGVIILSPLAVGFGVNIQAANHVIHFSRTWNPAKEDQATDRAYRIGQTRDVHVHYPIVTANDFTSFDLKLHTLLTWKRTLSHDMLNGAGDLGIGDFIDLK